MSVLCACAHLCSQIGLGFSALTLGGVSASHLDVAPRHAGVIFGAGNTAATLAGLISVPFTGYLLQVGSAPCTHTHTHTHTHTIISVPFTGYLLHVSKAHAYMIKCVHLTYAIRRFALLGGRLVVALRRVRYMILGSVALREVLRHGGPHNYVWHDTATSYAP